MKTILSSLAAILAVLSQVACSSPQAASQPGAINIRSGPFGPSIDIGGADGDDDTPVSVRIN